MNEHDWLTEPDFTAHVRFVADRLSPRRQRLLAVAFCRAAADLLDPELAAALDTIDGAADAPPHASAVLELTRQDCRAVAQKAYDIYRAATDAGTDAGTARARSELAWAVAFAATSPLPLVMVGERALDALAATRVDPVASTLRGLSPTFRVAVGAQMALARGVVWEVVGNPFRPVHFAPEWRTDTARAIARQMYESREFSAMPILADALQDAGCDSETLLRHCREGGAGHVRGCWALDLVLGLE